MFQILLETAPYSYRQWIIVTPRVPYPTVLVPYTVVKYEYSYRKVLYLPYYRIEPTTVPTVRYCGFHYEYLLRVPTTCSTTYYLLPATT